MTTAHTLRPSRAFSLVEILVVVVIIAILAAVIVPRIAGNSRSSAGKATTALAKAHDTECLMNIRSVRQCIEAFHSSDPDGKYPQSLADIRELTPDLRQCPVGRVPYVYNPETGEVHCPYPSHEGY